MVEGDAGLASLMLGAGSLTGLALETDGAGALAEAGWVPATGAGLHPEGNIAAVASKRPQIARGRNRPVIASSRQTHPRSGL